MTAARRHKPNGLTIVLATPKIIHTPEVISSAAPMPDPELKLLFPLPSLCHAGQMVAKKRRIPEFRVRHAFLIRIARLNFDQQNGRN